MKEVLNNSKKKYGAVVMERREKKCTKDKKEKVKSVKGSNNFKIDEI